MICPKCKCVYREGFTRCSDCGCKLRNFIKGEVSSIKQKQNEYDNREWIKIMFILVPIFMPFILVPISNLNNPILTSVVSLILCCLFISVGVLSIFKKLSLFGVTISTLMKIERKEYDFFDGLVNFIVIIIGFIMGISIFL